MQGERILVSQVQILELVDLVIKSLDKVLLEEGRQDSLSGTAPNLYAYHNVTSSCT